MITEIKCWNRATENNFFVLLSIKQKRVALTFKSVYGIEGVPIQIEPLQQYFHVVQFVLWVVLTSESMIEISCCDHTKETSSTVLSCGSICLSLVCV